MSILHFTPHYTPHLDAQPQSCRCRACVQASNATLLRRAATGFRWACEQLIVGFATLLLVGFVISDEIAMWLEHLDGRKLDRLATRGVACLLVAFTFYLTFVILLAWNTGAMDGVVR